MEIINMTPHKLNIYNDLGTKEVMTLEPCGIVPRCKQENVIVANYGGVPIYDMQFGEVIDLPEKKPTIYLVVSRLVKTAIPERDDLLCPGALLRNDKGQPIGCIGLSR